MAIARSEEMQLVGYALARCSVTDDPSRPGRPPEWLGTTSWRDTYALFYPALGDGREFSSFANSLKNARDAFDAHVPSGRVGWVQREGASQRNDGMVGRILRRWSTASDDELRGAVEEVLASWKADQEEEEVRAHTEGGTTILLVRRYERDAEARQQAVEIHGTTCMGCRFDFEFSYGPHGRGFIEVHHSIPLAEYGKRSTDPRTDLIVLCANCHRMVHRKRGVCLYLSNLQAKLAHSPCEVNGSCH